MYIPNTIRTIMLIHVHVFTVNMTSGPPNAFCTIFVISSTKLLSPLREKRERERAERHQERQK